MSPSKNRILRLAGWFREPTSWLWLAAVALLLPLLFQAFLGVYSRYQADDFCLAWNGTHRSLFNAVASWYRTDSSRFSTTLVFAISDKLGRWTVPILPAFVLGLWLAGSTWLFQQLQRRISLGLPPIASFFLAELLVYFVLKLTPDRFQVLYWRSGMVVYLLPVVLVTFLVIFLLKGMEQTQRRLKLLFAILALLFFFFNGGFSETIATIQIGMLMISLLGVLLFDRSKARPWKTWLVVFALLGTLLAMAALYFSPATQMRQGLIGEPPGLSSLLRMSLTNAFLVIYITLGEKAFPLLILLLTALTSGYLLFTRQGAERVSPTGLVGTLILAPLLTYAWMVCVSAPFAFGESAYPEGRVLVDAMFMLVLMVICEGFALGIGLGSLHNLSGTPAPPWLRIIFLLSLLGMSLFPLYSSRNGLKDLDFNRQRAQAWDERDGSIRSQIAEGQKDIVVTAFNSHAGLLEIGPDPNNWVNGCAALYYGVDSITAELP